MATEFQRSKEILALLRLVNEKKKYKEHETPMSEETLTRDDAHSITDLIKTDNRPTMAERNRFAETRRDEKHKNWENDFDDDDKYRYDGYREDRELERIRQVSEIEIFEYFI